MTAAVLGGGPAGLYAALLLARRGIPVKLFEREKRTGGLAAGRLIEGQSVDHGSHRVHPSIDPEILTDLQALLPSPLQERRRHGRIRLGENWLSFPLSMQELTSSLPPGILARLGFGALAALFRPASDATFAEVVTTGLGRPMGEMFYFPYARKIWGVDPGDLSGVQARRRISADTPFKLARRALASGSGRTFYYPAGGFGAIPEAIASAAASHDVDLRTGENVTGLVRNGDEWEVVTANGRHSAQLVLSTLPISVLTRMLAAPSSVLDAAAGLRSRAMVLVYLTVASARWTEYDAHYFPSDDVPFTRISEPKNYRVSPRDPPDRSVICVEMPCDTGEWVWAAEPGELIRLVQNAVVALGLPDPGHRGSVCRLAHAYPVYPVGVEDALDEVHGWLEDQSGLVTFGRQGLFAHDNTHHALAMARDAVACVSSSMEFDRAGWAAARERFAHHVVED